MNATPRSALALTCGLLALTSACKAAASGQADGSATPRRIVSLLPSATDILRALGAAGDLVARVDGDDLPAGLPSVGTGLRPDLERLTLLRPDLVVTWPDPLGPDLTTLERAGTEIYGPRTRTLADLFRTIDGLGRRMKRRTAADSLIRAIRSGLAGVRRSVRGRSRPRVLYLVWPSPPTVAGPGTFVDEVITIAGGANVFADAPAAWPEVSLESVLDRNPEVILFADSTATGIDARWFSETPGWRELEAVRRHRIGRLPARLMSRPGPDVDDLARSLAALFHPDVAAALGSPIGDASPPNPAGR